MLVFLLSSLTFQYILYIKFTFIHVFAPICIFLDILYVIGLFPHLLPEDLRPKTPANYPRPLADLQGADLERAYNALMEYLTDVRVGVMRQLKDMEEAGGGFSQSVSTCTGKVHVN